MINPEHQEACDMVPNDGSRKNNAQRSYSRIGPKPSASSVVSGRGSLGLRLGPCFPFVPVDCIQPWHEGYGNRLSKDCNL